MGSGMCKPEENDILNSEIKGRKQVRGILKSGKVREREEKESR